MVEMWISLVRNAACVLKSLLPKDYVVMRPFMSFPLQFLLQGQSEGSSKLDRFTGLEGVIGLLQLAGAGFNLCKGAKVSWLGRVVVGVAHRQLYISNNPYKAVRCKLSTCHLESRQQTASDFVPLSAAGVYRPHYNRTVQQYGLRTRYTEDWYTILRLYISGAQSLVSTLEVWCYTSTIA